MIIQIFDKTGSTFLTEFSEIISASIKDKLSNVSTNFFEIQADDLNISAINLQDYNKVKFFNNSNEFIFEGYIAGAEINFGLLRIIVNNQNTIWQKKLLYSDKTYPTGTTISSILQSNLDEINTRYNTGYILDCDLIDTISESVDFRKLDTFYNVLKFLSSLGYDFTTRGNKLEFKGLIGIDRTSGDDYFEYTYNINNPGENTISEVSGLRIGKNIANAITGKSSSNYVEKIDTDSINKFGRIEQSFSIDGDLTNGTENILIEKKESITEIKIIPIIENYNDLGLGDLVDCNIIWQNDLLNFSGFVKILEKKYTSSELNEFEFVLSPISFKNKTFLDEFAELQNKVQKLIIQ